MKEKIQINGKDLVRSSEKKQVNISRIWGILCLCTIMQLTASKEDDSNLVEREEIVEKADLK